MWQVDGEKKLRKVIKAQLKALIHFFIQTMRREERNLLHDLCNWKSICRFTAILESILLASLLIGLISISECELWFKFTQISRFFFFQKRDFTKKN